MTDVIEHAQWMKLTDGGVASVPSHRLKAIDAALLRYQQVKTAANLDVLRTSVMGWISKEGPIGRRASATGSTRWTTCIGRRWALRG